LVVQIHLPHPDQETAIIKEKGTRERKAVLRNRPEGEGEEGVGHIPDLHLPPEKAETTRKELKSTYRKETADLNLEGEEKKGRGMNLTSNHYQILELLQVGNKVLLEAITQLISQLRLLLSKRGRILLIQYAPYLRPNPSVL
jgi:hypothetical protein